jgi:hypothetical protein
MFRVRTSKDPIQTIHNLIEFNEAVNQMERVSEIGPRWKSLKKNIIDYLVNLENNFSKLEFSEISELEFHTILENILESTKNEFYEVRQRNQAHKSDFDFILSVLDAVSKTNKNKIKDLHN